MISVALCAVVGTSCAAAPPAPASPSEAADTPASPEAACLAQAAAERTPKPGAPDKIVLSHILVRHKELKRPEGATLSRGQACLRAQAAREKLLAGGEWASVSEEYSDAAGATGGDLGSVAKDQLDATFGAAAFALEAGELSHVVETERGFHVIARTE